jgi:transcriptional regulator with XRE-family HTH domain
MCLYQGSIHPTSHKANSRNFAVARSPFRRLGGGAGAHTRRVWQEGATPAEKFQESGSPWPPGIVCVTMDAPLRRYFTCAESRNVWKKLDRAAFALDLCRFCRYYGYIMRDVPQLKLVREDQGWSQRDLAARSGVAPNTISQLERGERKAMPSTVRKLADALGVDPPVLMAESRIDAYMPREQEAVSRAPSAEDRVSQRDRSLQYRELIESLGAPDEFLPKRRKEELQRHFEREIAADKRLDKPQKEELQGLLERMSAGWAEYYVSGKAADQEEVARKHKIASFQDQLDEPLSEERIDALFAAPGERHRMNIIPALVSYPEDLNVAQSRLASNDPNEILEAARLLLRRAKRIVEEYHSKLQSFRRIPEHYYEDPAAQSRIQKLQETLSVRRVEAAEAVQELVDLYDECLDTLEDQILGMRKESDVLVEFVTQIHKWGR